MLDPVAIGHRIAAREVIKRWTALDGFMVRWRRW